MIKSFIKSIFRGFKKQKMTTLINLLGLSIGITLVVFISVYIINEIESDKFHKNLKNVYRVEESSSSMSYPITPDPLAGWLKGNFPEIELTTRIFSPFYKSQQYISVGQQSFNVAKPLYVDPSFFQMFSFPVAIGKTDNPLGDKYSVVLTESLARKIFGDENPVGKALKYEGKYLFTVTAVLEKFPDNSSMEFDMLMPFDAVHEFDLNNWNNSAYQTFIQTKTKQSGLIEKINHTFKKQFPEHEFSYFLTPLTNIHFVSGSNYDMVFRHGNKTELLLFLFVAIGILVIAVINFVNLSFAVSSLQIKESVIRKIEGASRINILLHNIAKSALLGLLSAVIAGILVQILFPLFNNLLYSPIENSRIQNPLFLLVLMGLGLFTGILAGLFPALKFSSIPINKVLRSKQSNTGQSGKWRNSLIVFQFAVSITLIISTIFVNRQMDFIQTQALGFDKEHVLYLSLSNDLNQKLDVIKEELTGNAGVSDVASCDFIPGQAYSQWRLDLKGGGEEKTIDSYHTRVSAKYVETMGLELVGGRNFEPYEDANRKSYLVNETFVKEFGIANPLEETINNSKIVGVVKDFNYGSLHQKVAPLAIQLSDEQNTTLLLRVNAKNAASASSLVTSIRNTVLHDLPGAYAEVKFMEQQIEGQYRKEAKTTLLLNCFTFFAIFISCLGLFALAVFTIRQRTKEIGIRKVNGAKITEILTMLNKDFIKWVAIAFVIATPVAYYTMNKWLENFAYKTTLSWWIFALAGVLALGIALLTVSWQSWRAATRNPVEALRYE